MKKILLPILGTIAFIIAVGLLAKGSLFNSNVGVITKADKQVSIGTTTVKVEIADTDQKRSLGLGNRTSLEAGHGMLFVFPTKPSIRNFWMKDMSFAIDIIWIKDGKIVKIDKNVEPQPGATDPELKIYSSGQPIDYVLEVNANFSDSKAIKVGDPVELSKAL